MAKDDGDNSGSIRQAAAPRTRNKEEQTSPDDSRCKASSINLQKLRKIIADSRKIVPDDTDEDPNSIRWFRTRSALNTEKS